MSADGSPVRLVIPAQARFLRLARLTAAGIAGDLGFGLEAIEDLRVAVDEAAAILMEGAAEGAEIELVYRTAEGGMVIEGSCENPQAEPEIHPVAAELLAMTADDHSVYSTGDVISFRLLKRLEVTSG